MFVRAERVERKTFDFAWGDGVEREGFFFTVEANPTFFINLGKAFRVKAYTSQVIVLVAQRATYSFFVQTKNFFTFSAVISRAFIADPFKRLNFAEGLKLCFGQFTARKMVPFKAYITSNSIIFTFVLNLFLAFGARISWHEKGKRGGSVNL